MLHTGITRRFAGDEIKLETQHVTKPAGGACDIGYRDHRLKAMKLVLGAESDFGAGRIYEVRFGVAGHAQDAARRIAEVLAPVGIVYSSEKANAGPDISHIAAQGMAFAQLAQDGTSYFDYHHTANDTLDKVDPKDLDQNVAAYAVLAWLAAQAEGDFGSAPIPRAAESTATKQ